MLYWFYILLHNWMDRSNALKELNLFFVIAQEIVDTFPELVRGTDGQYTVAYSKLSVYILKALQEQHEEIDLLEKEILALLAADEK